MKHIDPRNANFTIEQVRELMDGTCLVRNMKPGDIVHWSCGHVEWGTGERCDFKFDEDVTEYIEQADWPERLIEHIWSNGHINVTNHNVYEPLYAEREREGDSEPLLRMWARGMVRLLLLMLPVAVLMIGVAFVPEVVVWFLLILTGIVLFVIAPFFLAGDRSRR